MLCITGLPLIFGHEIDDWLTAVGLTGVINTLAMPILWFWQFDQLAEMVRPYRERSPPERLAKVDLALEAVRREAPDTEIHSIWFPGSPFSSRHHYAVYLKGNTPLTSRILKPALIDAQDGQLTDMREVPGYVKAFFLSQPLHFGDYGGLPLKLVWALMTVVTIIVPGSGIYLLLRKGRDIPALDAASNERTPR